MSYVSVNINVDIDDIIDNLSKSDIKIILQEITNKELLEECKRREMSTVKSINVNSFILGSNYLKREFLINLLDLPSYVNDSDILKAVQENI